MNCPHCNQNVPDNNYICPQCGKVLHPDKEPTDFVKKKLKPPRVSTNLVIILIILVGIALLAYIYLSKEKAGSTGSGSENGEISQSMGSETASAGEVVNAENPGQEFDIKPFVQEGKTTIFDFYSEYCPPCRKISPLLERLDLKREDIVVFKVDINRPGVKGIDWSSPLARQYRLRSIPHFKIYDPGGDLSHENKPAYLEVQRLLREEMIIQ